MLLGSMGLHLHGKKPSINATVKSGHNHLGNRAVVKAKSTTSNADIHKNAQEIDNILQKKRHSQEKWSAIPIGKYAIANILGQIKEKNIEAYQYFTQSPEKATEIFVELAKNLVMPQPFAQRNIFRTFFGYNKDDMYRLQQALSLLGEHQLTSEHIEIIDFLLDAHKNHTKNINVLLTPQLHFKTAQDLILPDQKGLDYLKKRFNVEKQNEADIQKSKEILQKIPTTHQGSDGAYEHDYVHLVANMLLLWAGNKAYTKTLEEKDKPIIRETIGLAQDMAYGIHDIFANYYMNTLKEKGKVAFPALVHPKHIVGALIEKTKNNQYYISFYDGSNHIYNAQKLHSIEDLFNVENVSNFKIKDGKHNHILHMTQNATDDGVPLYPVRVKNENIPAYLLPFLDLNDEQTSSQNHKIAGQFNDNCYFHNMLFTILDNMPPHLQKDFMRYMLDTKKDNADLLIDMLQGSQTLLI